MDSSLWQVKREHILKIETQTNERTGKDFAAVTFRHQGTEKFAIVKNLVDKPADMELLDWCVTILNTHYLVREAEKKRGKKIQLVQPVTY